MFNVNSLHKIQECMEDSVSTAAEIQTSSNHSEMHNPAHTILEGISGLSSQECTCSSQTWKE